MFFRLEVGRIVVSLMSTSLHAAGICFGHQIVARALGKDCVPNNGVWEVGPTPIDLTETGKQLFGGLDKLVSLMVLQIVHRSR